MREVIKTGRTVEDATELALAELGVSAEEAGIEVLELPQRRLFKSIPAKVRAYVEDEEVPEAPAPKEEKPLPKAAPKAAESPDAPKAEAPGTAGELKLYDTDPRDAAMIMAIVADTLQKPLNQLRFISIKEVKDDEV